jgi:hypothetical protein
MADVEKTEKGLADAKNVITSKDCEVSTLKEQVQCVLVLAHCCLFARMFANVESCVRVFTVGWCFNVCKFVRV